MSTAKKIRLTAEYLEAREIVGPGVMSTAKKIRLTGPILPVIRDTSTPLPRVTPEMVATSLGADVSGQGLVEALAPITLFALRSELLGRLQSSGGRPALSNTSRRAKIPLGDAEWAELEELAAAVSAPGFSPSAGQIASVLLSLALRSVHSRVARSAKPASSPLARELAARSTAGPAKRRPKPG
jgi:hypothetical protein